MGPVARIWIVFRTILPWPVPVTVPVVAIFITIFFCAPLWLIHYQEVHCITYVASSAYPSSDLGPPFVYEFECTVICVATKFGKVSKEEGHETDEIPAYKHMEKWNQAMKMENGSWSSASDCVRINYSDWDRDHEFIWTIERDRNSSLDMSYYEVARSNSLGGERECLFTVTQPIIDIIRFNVVVDPISVKEPWAWFVNCPDVAVGAVCWSDFKLDLSTTPFILIWKSHWRWDLIVGPRRPGWTRPEIRQGVLLQLLPILFETL